MDYQTVLNHGPEAEKKQSHAPFGGTVRATFWRWPVFLGLLVVFFAALVLSLQPKEEAVEGCLGVPILSEEEMAQYQTYSYQNYSESLKYQDEFAAVDEEASVIYISQNIGQGTEAPDLTGTLSIDHPGCQLYFAPDECWDDLSNAVRDGHRFTLLVSDYKNTYMKYDVVFTTLPVISVYGKLLYKDEELREIMTGKVILWDPRQAENEGVEVMSSNVHWHIRGGSSAYEPKTPYKLSLKNVEGKNKNEDLLGLGSDDDWILNPMNMEDSNIREKLFMDMWNEMAAETDYNYRMSCGEYVEVLINGEYYGLCLLQRRLDEKYLKLGENTVLIKANPVDETLVYEFFSVDNTQPSETALNEFFLELNCEPVVVENFIDVSLFLQLFSTGDNLIYKNMYYLFDQTGEETSITLIPWDTDMAMGAIWGGDGIGFAYDYDVSVNNVLLRQEFESMQQLYLDLNRDLSARWFELRETIFSEEHITGMMDRYLDTLDSSGAVARDQEKWGLFYDGADTIENLYRFVKERLQILDQYYSE